MDDEPPAGGLSPEKADELRKLLPVLESRIKNLHGNPSFDDIAQEVRDLRKAVDDANKSNALEQVTKSIRSICEGVVGGIVVELIPENLKGWMKEHMGLSDNTKFGHKLADDRLLIVKLELVEGVRTIDIILEQEVPAILTFSPPYMRVWRQYRMAVFLRLALIRSWVEHPTAHEIEEMKDARFERLTPASAQEVKKAISALAHEDEQRRQAQRHRRPDRHSPAPEHRT